MNKIIYFSLASVLSLLFFTTSAPLEAGRCYPRGSVHVGLGTRIISPERPMVRRCVRQVPVQYGVVMPGPYAAPVYVNQVHPYAAPVYVEEVVVAPPRRVISFSGLSFSFNLFR